MSYDLTWPRGLSNIWLLGYLYLSHQLDKLYDHRPCQRGYITLLICHVNRNLQSAQRVMWLHGWVLLTISHQPAMLGGHGPCERRDTKFSICREISRDSMVRGTCVIMGWVPLIISHHPAKSDGHRELTLVGMWKGINKRNMMLYDDITLFWCIWRTVLC